MEVRPYFFAITDLTRLFDVLNVVKVPKSVREYSFFTLLLLLASDVESQIWKKAGDEKTECSSLP